MDISDKSTRSLSPPEYIEKSSLGERRVDDDEEQEFLIQSHANKQEYSNKDRKKTFRCFSLDLKYWLAINIILTIFNLAALLSFTLFKHSSPLVQQDSKYLLPPSPAIEAIEKHLRPFSLTSEYSNHPGPETDQLWESLVNTGAIFPLTKEEFMEVNDSPETGVKLTNDPQGRYVGTLASTHQIHCVDSLRKAMWFHYKHYQDIGDSLFTGKDPAEEHLMHCVEMLRNAIMCTGDVSVITYNWEKGHEIPKADFKSVHACQKWDKLEKWRQDNNVTPLLKVLERPVGLLDEEPEESEGFAPGGYSSSDGAHRGGNDGDY